jgi:putative MATE family efflux protein
MNERLDLGKDAIFPLILKMSWPSIISMTAMALYNFIDTFWLARYSSQALAALTICFPIQLIAAAVGLGTGIGAGSFAARMLGAGKILQARQTAGQIFFLSFLFGAVMIISVLLFGDEIILAFGATQEIMPLCRDYLYIVVFCAPFGLFTLMANNLLRAEGRPLLSMYVFLITFAVSIILDPLLIFGIGPFPAMGIKGVAIAVLTANLLSFLSSLIFLTSKSSRYEFKLQYTRPNIQILKSIYSTGLPSMITDLIIVFFMVIYNHALAGYGFRAIAAFGICFRITSMATMVVLGIGAGLMPIIAFNKGARLYQRLRESVYAGLKVSLSFAAVAFVLIEIFAAPIVGIFSKDTALIVMGVENLRIHALALVMIAYFIIIINVFMGLGKGSLAMFLLFFRDIVVFIPLLIILPYFWEIRGAWLAFPLSNLIAIFVVVYLTNKEMRRYESG